MEDKEKLMVKYRKAKNVLDLLSPIFAISMGGFFMFLLLWIVSYDSNKLLTIHEISKNLWIIQTILLICVIIIGFRLVNKEEKLEEQLGIKEDESNKDVQT